MLRVVILSVAIMYCYAEYRYAEFHYAGGRNDEWRCDECRGAYWKAHLQLELKIRPRFVLLLVVVHGLTCSKTAHCCNLIPFCYRTPWMNQGHWGSMVQRCLSVICTVSIITEKNLYFLKRCMLTVNKDVHMFHSGPRACTVKLFTAVIAVVS